MGKFTGILDYKPNEQFHTYTDERWPLGTMMEDQLGRRWRFGKNSTGTAAVAGNLHQAAAGSTVFEALAVVTGAADSRSLTLTAADAIAINRFKNGYAVIEGSPGNGYAYLIASHPAITSGASGVITLAENIQVALTTGTTVSLIHSRYRNTVVYPTTLTGIPVGVAMKPFGATATAYGWYQTKGSCAVAGQGTLVRGGPVCGSTATAGAVTPVTTALVNIPIVGWVQRVITSGSHSTVYLTLE